MAKSSFLLVWIKLILVSLFIYGCGQSSQPSINSISLIQNPNPTVPLAAILNVSSSEPTTLSINIDDGEKSWSVNPNNIMQSDHEVPVLGMRSDRMHTITASLTNADGNSITSEELFFETPPLPEAYPTPIINAYVEGEIEPGVTLFNINGRWNNDYPIVSTPANFSPAVIVDDMGEIIWYYLPEDHRVHDIRPWGNEGNLVYEIWAPSAWAGKVEIDMLGNIKRRWHFTGTAGNIAEGSIPVETDSYHHDYSELPNGNILLMSTENRVIENWYTSETDPNAPRAAQNVIGDIIIEMTLEGEVIREWKIHDILDVNRIGYNSLRKNYWANHYQYADYVDTEAYGQVNDWSHGNAIIYEPKDHSFIMSVPYQDAVIKVDMDTGELVWILGNHDNWVEPWSDKLLTPVGDVGWSYKHHAISHTEKGTFLLFDNGVGRASPFDERMALEESYSRAVEYAVDEENMEVRQVWEYGPGDEVFYGRYLGDVDWLPQMDNVLINVGARETNSEGVNQSPGAEGTQRWASLIEVTNESPAKKVWEMRLKQDDSNWSIYRSERLSSIYHWVD